MTEHDHLDTPNCPRDLTPLVAVGDALDGSDARWECPTCGYASIV